MRLIKAVRAHFDEQGFWEVETPILQVSPVMDTHIHAFKTEILGTDLAHDRDLYLHTSPEFAMKKLMVAGIPKMYQVCHVFRNGEASSRHSAEFTMIEWYRAAKDGTGGSYRDIMNDCINLLRYIAEKLEIKELTYGAYTVDPFLEWSIITVTEAFDKYCKIDLENCLEDRGGFAVAATAQGVRVSDDDSWEDIFFAVMDAKIEPHLGVRVPTILIDYPASMASLSRKKPEDPRFAERFELYVCGLELANAFGELTDAAEQRKRFDQEMALKQKLYGEQYPIDEEFLAALEYGLPESGGIALGIDRLAMLVSGAETIDQVLWCGKP